MVDIYDENLEEEKPKKKRATAVALSKPDGYLPTISAAGYGTVAEQILEIAFANGINVREDGDLAEMLAKIELDSEIPSEALVAVAEILSYVYKLNSYKRLEKLDE